MKDVTENEGGCTVPWVLDEKKGPKKICKMSKNMNKTFWIAWNRVTNQEQDCPNPCQILSISLSGKNYQVFKVDF